MKAFLSILVFVSFSLLGQDKLFYKSGAVSKGTIVSIAHEFIYFKKNDTTQTEQVKISDLLLVEKYNGERHIFASEEVKEKYNETAQDSLRVLRNSIGIQPFGVFFGRLTLLFEHLSKNGKVGYVFPFVLTFNPSNSIYKALRDTSADAPVQVTGLSYIVGIDINYYFKKSAGSQFFIGPRLRYGTDQFLLGTEGYSIQSQLGWKFSGGRNAVQHISLGFGFVRILSAPQNTNIDSKQSYLWGSINYRLSWAW